MSRPSAPRWLGDPFASVADSVFNGSHEGIVVIDERQHIVMVNPAALRMLGCVASEALGQDLGHFIPAHRHAAHVGQLHESAASAPAEWLPPQVASLVGRRANGEEFPVAVTISRVDVAGELGTRHCFTALLRDLSAEHDQQAEVQALNARLRGIFDLALSADRPIPCLTERIARLDGGERDVEIAVAALPDHGRSTVQMVINDITERARTGRELEQSRARMQQLAAHQIQAVEEERQRIARELHDELGQRLTALKLELVRCAREPTSAATGPAVDHLLAMVDDTVAAVRRLATDLRPAMLDDLGLNAAVAVCRLVQDASAAGRRVRVRLPLWPGGPLNPAGPGA